MWLLLLCLPASEEMTKKKPYNCNILHSCIKYLGCFLLGHYQNHFREDLSKQVIPLGVHVSELLIL